MKKLLILMGILLALAGCGTVSQPIHGNARSGSAMFGTLAAFGTFEMQLAPAYTRLAVLRHRASRALTEKRIHVHTAEFIQSTADRARDLLDAAHAQTLDGKERPAAKLDLEQAIKWIKAGEEALEVKQ